MSISPKNQTSPLSTIFSCLYLKRRVRSPSPATDCITPCQMLHAKKELKNRDIIFWCFVTWRKAACGAFCIIK